MTKLPLVSVLMPAFNAEKFIAEAIDSIIGQSHQHWELLILDDASTDGTLAIIESYSDTRIKVLRNETNQGYLLSCNRLFSEAQGDFITFQDADDTCDSERLAICIDQFTIQPEIDFLTTDHARIDSSGQVLDERSTDVDYQRYCSDHSYTPTICCATIFARHSILNKVGGYHPFFKNLGGEDYHWLWNLSRTGKGIHLQQTLYNYRQHAGQVHLTNPDKLKHFVTDIISEIRRDGMSNKALSEKAEEVERKWKEHLQANPGLLKLRLATEALNSRQYSRFMDHWMAALFSRPASISKFRQCAYLLYSYIARIA
ncbi:MAG: glycosyltransferase [Flavobacteriales bacterium]|nr:glycosyltransferase [Flavobacteriales bacterium]